jgi:hypothetical protein
LKLLIFNNLLINLLISSEAYPIYQFSNLNKKKMYRIIFICLAGLLTLTGKSQVIQVSPQYPTVNDEITVVLDVSQCDCDLEDYTGDIYAHTGLITPESSDPGDWKYVIAEWSENLEKAKLTKTGTTTYELLITPNLKTYYGTDAGETVQELAFVFRNSDGSKQTSNIYYDVYEPGLNIEFTNPSDNIAISIDDTLQISAKSVYLGTPVPDSMMLFIDDSLHAVTYADSVEYEFVPEETGKHWITVQSVNPEYDVKDSIYCFVYGDIVIEDTPEGVVDGINYIDTSTVTLVLYAPGKESVFVIGGFNDWELDTSYLMKETPDGKRFWRTLTNLEKGKEYIFQYLVDGSLHIADPYTEKIADPQNDTTIPASVYPDIPQYPYGKTTRIASILQTGQEEYTWNVTDFTPPAAQDLVIYELYVHDFVSTHHITTVMDSLDYLESLGVNAIELMPVNEFEGNQSWGYNPSFYFAFDKYYGTKTELQTFIDECHERGIAVFIDMVLNHCYGQSPFVRLYYDESTGQVTEDNPWINVTCPNTEYCWGFDFNQERQVVKDLVDRVNRFWLTEYNIDGFRFDFTKGFTNTENNGWNYDSSRIAILERMYDSIKSVKENAIVILEHLTENSEEKELAEYGMLLWGNMNSQYNEATMGYNTGAKSDLSGASYKSRGWDVPHLVAYMESHDEERIMFKNITYGNSADGYDVTNINTALRRVELAANFFFTIPGPKMIWEFGELGFDTSIDDPCRLCPKDPPWDYMEDPARMKLYHLFSTLIDLKLNYNVFETDDFSMSVVSAMKRINLNDEDMNVTVIGNFDVVEGTADPNFQHTGSWYSYYTGDTLQVNDVNAEIALKPGEYRLYTDVKLERPEIGLGSKVNTFQEGTVNIYPNPASDQVYFRIHSDEPGDILLKIFDISGRIVYASEKSIANTGDTEIEWNLLDNNAGKVEKGTYIYTLMANKKQFIGKLLVY